MALRIADEGPDDEEQGLHSMWAMLKNEDVANTDDYGMTNQHHYISLSVDRIAEY
jgi:hypothetical protein